MTYEINNDFDEIILNSEYLVNTNQSVTLTVVKNCATTYTMDVNVGSTLISISPEDFNQEDVFEGGPYSFKLYTVQEDGTIVIEYLCRYIQPDTCAYIDLYKDVSNLAKVMAHQALLAINECEQCSCSDACLFYATINNETCDACSCGCSTTTMSICNGSC